MLIPCIFLTWHQSPPIADHAATHLKVECCCALPIAEQAEHTQPIGNHLGRIHKQASNITHCYTAFRMDRTGEPTNRRTEKLLCTGNGYETVDTKQEICFCVQMDSSSNLISSTSNRFYWIRIALFEKRLHKIVGYLTQNADRFENHPAVNA